MDISNLLQGGGKKKKDADNKKKKSTEEQEDDVLASLGTTRAETTSYESNLLRQATHQLAPDLRVDLEDDNDRFIGFPDFITETSLLPFSSQKQGKANRQVVMRVLGKIQEQMNYADGTDRDKMRILAFQQNILLSMLGQQSKKPAIQQLWKQQANTEEIYKQTEIGGRKRVSMMERKQIPGTESLAKAQQLTRTNSRKKKAWKDWSSDEEEEDDEAPKTRPVLPEMNYSRRRLGKTLTRKQTTKPRNASVHRDMTRRNRSKRVRTAVKSYKEKDVDILDADNDDPEVKKEQMDFDLRNTSTNTPTSGRSRRNRTQVQSYAEDDDEKDMDEELSEVEAQAQENGKGSDKLNETSAKNRTGSADDKENTGEVAARRKVKIEEGEDVNDANIEATSATPLDNGAPSSVTCPLCQTTLAITDPAQTDTELAQHMASCQQEQSPSRRSSRRRTAPTHGYEDGVEENDEPVLGREGRKRKRVAVKTEDEGEETETRDDTQFEFDAETSEDEELEAEDEVIDPADIPLEKPTAIDDYLLDDYEDRVDYWREHGVSEMRDMSKLKAEGEMDPGAVTLEGGLHIPAWMNNRLFGYQRTGLEWMWTLHQQQAGGVMGDEMGLGKTVQVSSFLGAMAASRKLKGVLIIAPATMLQHWLSELTVWAPGLRRVLLHSSGDGGSAVETPRNIVNQGPAIFRNLRDWLKEARKERLYERIEDLEGGDGEEPEDTFCGTGYAVITTYEHVRRNQDDYVNHRWSYVVMDEAQKIRNPQADITLACKRLRTPHRIAMTGTPIQNDLKELWSLFDFVFPGRLGTLPAFEEEFAGPIKRGGYSNASPVQVQLAYRCSLVLRDLIDPYLLRRQKAEIDEVRRMPSKTEHVLFCRLSKRQRRMYESFLQSDMVKKIFKGSTLLFAAVTMLRKICNHPDLVLSDPSDEALEAFLRHGCVPEQITNSDDDDDDVDAIESNPFPDAGDRLEKRSGKFEVMAKILPLWKKQGHRVLIFSQWTKMLNIIQQFVMAQGWKFLRLDGKTSVASRQKLVDQFNTDKSFFGMLCTTRTGGVGLNLTGANKLVLYDVDWNPQTDAQARERAWRFGQEKQVTVYRLCTAGTIEEKMYQRQIFKTALTNKVLHDPRQKRLFSQKDLHDLLTLQPDNGKEGGEIETTERLAKANRHDQGGGSMNAQEVSEEDGETLKSVLKSKGLAGVFDHNFVDPSGGANKSISAREMEEQAKKIAKEAAEALRASVASEDDPFTPTWTGAPDSRFGGGTSAMAERRGSGPKFGGAVTAGVRSAKGGSKSSGSLLASIREQNEAIKSGGARRPNLDSKESSGKNGKYTKLMIRIRDFVRKNSPTSDEILFAFEDVPSNDAAIFKQLLTSVARKEQGRWKLLPEHR